MQDKKNLTLLQINDVHGYLEEHWEHFYEGNESVYTQVGGYARMAGYVRQVHKERNGSVLLFDGGDTFHGTHPVVDTKGQILLPILREMGIDAMTGHWDFAYGPDYLQELVASLGHPMLAINCYDKKTDRLAFPPFLVKAVNDLKIGVIGIAATIVDKVMPPNFSEGVYFTLGNEELPDYIQKLKKEQNVDLIVVLSHLGLPQDIQLAEEVDGIQVLLSAHTHNRLYEPVTVNDTIIIQSGCHGSFVGRLDLVVKNKQIVEHDHQLVLMDEQIPEDKAMKKIVDEGMRPYRNQLDEVIGATETGLHRHAILESTMDNFLLKGLLDYTKAEVAFSNGWRYGAPIPPGELTMNDIWNIIPVNPPISTVTLKGKEIWELMEKSLEVTFSRNPYHQMGGYVKRVLGLNLYAKLENPSGQRMQSLFVGNEPVAMDRLYNVAFITMQGVPHSYGKDRRNLEIHAVDALKEYVIKNRTIEASLRGTVTLI
ncbi:bifunctional metallophosphatase/5'-nucleotidase [Mammaliicoccus sciuri]